MKIINPVGWSIQNPKSVQDLNIPLISFINERGHQFHIHPINSRLVRIVHSLPKSELGANGELGGIQLRNHIKTGEGVGLDGFHWEKRIDDWSVDIDEKEKRIKIQSKKGGLIMEVDYSNTIALTWNWKERIQEKDTQIPFLTDFKTAYQYDARSKRVYHTVCRDQSYMPLSEHTLPSNENHIPQKGRFEFIYGLGEVKGPMMKDGKRYLIEARDSLGADPQETDPLYKLCPFYLHFNRNTNIWFGLYYNTLVPSIFDFSAEHDFATGQFRSFSAERGPLDYYVLLGEEDGHYSKPKVADIVSQFASLVTPSSFGPAGRRSLNTAPPSPLTGWQASPTLPPHNQFGYLASSLTLSERKDAQFAVVEYVEKARRHGFPIDSMHLSSGYCVDSKTGERNYFYWDKTKYPEPARMGIALEKEMSCKVIINVKPWLLETHPYYQQSAEKSIFIKAAKDARPPNANQLVQRNSDRCGKYISTPSRTLHWARGMGDTGKGSYIDYSSKAGSEEWKRLIKIGVLENNITGLWIDNNEFSSNIDDEDEIQGEINFWSLPSSSIQSSTQNEEQTRLVNEVANRVGWSSTSPIEIGTVGAATLTMGMARATFDGLLHYSSESERPVIVTRSAVPGISAFAHSTWSGDNSTSWLSLRWSTKLSMSVGLSFGLGLYGHDIGGFAGEHSPSAELLIRWCQQSMWMTRFTIHSWKQISTTPWMYEDLCEGEKEKTVKDILLEIILFRYRLLPTLYSLFVTQYHRHAWPVVRPLLWHHSNHFECLTQDEQFLVGSHILIAPVCTFGERIAKFFLPSMVDDDLAIKDLCWYDLNNKEKIYHPAKDGNIVEIDAPLSKCPTLIREGGIFILGPTQTRNMPTPASKHKHYEAHLFPCTSNMLAERGSNFATNGSFTLFEDDGCTNSASFKGDFTEFTINFQATNVQPKTLFVFIELLHINYSGRWDIELILPKVSGYQDVGFVYPRRNRIFGNKVEISHTNIDRNVFTVIVN